ADRRDRVATNGDVRDARLGVRGAVDDRPADEHEIERSVVPRAILVMPNLCQPRLERREKGYPMAKIVVSEFLTLDGVMQAPGGKDEDTSGGFDKGGWQLGDPDEGFGSVVLEGCERADGLLLGRRTYDLFASYWP